MELKMKVDVLYVVRNYVMKTVLNCVLVRLANVVNRELEVTTGQMANAQNAKEMNTKV